MQASMYGIVSGSLTCLVTITATARRIFGLLGREEVLGGVLLVLILEVNLTLGDWP